MDFHIITSKGMFHVHSTAGGEVLAPSPTPIAQEQPENAGPEKPEIILADAPH